MPRVNLTEAEAAQIRKQRELAAQHNATYNHALSDFLTEAQECIEDPVARECLQRIAARLVRLK